MTTVSRSPSLPADFAPLVDARGEDGELLGVCALGRDPYSRDPDHGRRRHLDVRPAARGRGAGRLLVDAARADARAATRRCVP